MLVEEKKNNLIQSFLSYKPNAKFYARQKKLIF